MQYVTIQQMKKIDQNAATYGMPIELMMENAGREICNQVLKIIKKYKIKKILVIAGNGNNGGGVIAASRHLSIHGISLKLAILGTKNSSIQNKLNLSLVRKNPKIQIIHSSKNLKKLLSEIQNSELILDGIFGIGISRGIVEPYYSIISAINDSKAYVISNDVPSGIDADSGKTYNIAVKSNYLVVLHKPKKWMLNNKTHKFIVVNIGIPIEVNS